MPTTLTDAHFDVRTSEAGIVLRFDLPNDQFFEVELDRTNCLFLKNVIELKEKD